MPTYLTRYRAALAVTITPHSLRDPERFLGVDKSPSSSERLLVFRSSVICSWPDRATIVLLAANVAFQAEQDNRQGIVVVEMFLHERLPVRAHVTQRLRVRDGIAQDNDRGPEEGVVFGRGGVGEFEAVGPVVHADVEGEGLV